MNQEDIKYQKAKRKVAAMRGFYIHLSVYVLVNLLLLLINISVSPESLWFFWPLLAWGVAIALHAFSVFGSERLFGPEWEEKKIAEIMEE